MKRYKLEALSANIIRKFELWSNFMSFLSFAWNELLIALNLLDIIKDCQVIFEG